MNVVKYTDRAGRKDQIYEVLNTLNRSLTLHEIARMIHLSPSTHLRKIANEMVAEGDLFSCVVAHRPNVQKVLYSAVDFGAKREQPKLL